MAEPIAPPRGSSNGTGRESRPQVIYVMGAGRSGSTILGVTLGNCDGVFFAGELDAWLARSGEPQVQDAERMRFWETVRGRVAGASELYGNRVQRTIERSLSLFRIGLWRDRRSLQGPYRRVSESLYGAVAAVSGASAIVDSSHYPLRAREMQRLKGVDLYLVYLMRDPQSVVASFNRKDVAQYSKSTLTTNVYLWLTSLLSVMVFLSHPRERRLFVRYEDFIADPATVVGEIVGLAGLHPPTPDLTELHTGLAFQGNRVIRTPVIALDTEPTRPGPSSWVTAALQGPCSAVIERLTPAAGALNHRSHAHAAGR